MLNMSYSNHNSSYIILQHCSRTRRPRSSAVTPGNCRATQHLRTRIYAIVSVPFFMISSLIFRLSNRGTRTPLLTLATLRWDYHTFTKIKITGPKIFFNFSFKISHLFLQSFMPKERLQTLHTKIHITGSKIFFEIQLQNFTPSLTEHQD